jgi:hypothetical protein
MKRIILGLSILLILVQNGFAEGSNGDWLRYLVECSAQATQATKYDNHAYFKVNMDGCHKAIMILETTPKLSKMQNDALTESYTNMGVLYYYKSDWINSYKYLKIAADRGNLIARRNLENVLCKEHPWACKQ